MKIPLARMEWAGIVLMILGAVVHFGGNHLSLSEIALAPDPRHGMLRAMQRVPSESKDLSETITTTFRRVGEAADKTSQKAHSHYSKASSWSLVANFGFALFLLGISSFVIGSRMRDVPSNSDSSDKARGTARDTDRENSRQDQPPNDDSAPAPPAPPPGD